MNYNRRYFEKDGKKYIEIKRIGLPTRVFEIVEEFPQGYILWLVSKNYPDAGYIALAKPSNVPYNIIQDELKCMFVGEEMWDKLHSYCHKGNEINATNFKSVYNSLKLDL